MTKEQIDQMVNAFLCWKIPQTFNPDCYISFAPKSDFRGNPPTWPVGTNLFSYTEAKAMVEQVYAKLAPEYLQGAVMATTRGLRKFAKVRPPDPPPDVARPPDNPAISRDRMVGATGIEPVTPTMSRIDEPATDLIGAGFSVPANAQNAPQLAGTSPQHAKVSQGSLRIVPGRIQLPAAANDGPKGPPPSAPAGRLMRKP